MKIAILSDTHDNIAHTKTVVEQAEGLGAEALIFCGDFCAPACGAIMAAFKNGPVHMIFGNNDGDVLSITKRTLEVNPAVQFHAEGKGMFTLADKRIALTHYPVYGIALAKTGDYDLVCYGHDHKARIDVFGSCVAVNPGCLSVVHLDVRPSFAIYDSALHKATLYNLNGKEV